MWVEKSADGLVAKMAEQRAGNWAFQTAVRKAVPMVVLSVQLRVVHSAAMLVWSSVVSKADHSDAQKAARMVDL